MQLEDNNLTPSVIIAVARELLSKNGFRIASEMGFPVLESRYALLAEDEYSVLVLAAYETWSELDNDWSNAQAELVGLFSKRLARSSPKAWDGYLVLMCPAPVQDHAAIAAIERDTTRVRKIVATGNVLRTTKDVERILDPFMPLELPGNWAQLQDVLESLPDVLRDDVPVLATQTVIDAFRSMEPPLERLHELGETE